MCNNLFTIIYDAFLRLFYKSFNYENYHYDSNTDINADSDENDDLVYSSDEDNEYDFYSDIDRQVMYMIINQPREFSYGYD